MAIQPLDIQRYLETILGVPTDLKRVKLKLPYHLQDAYTFIVLTLRFDPTPLEILLLVPGDPIYPGAVTLTKHIAQVRKAALATPVYLCQALSPADRRSLINHQLNFIQPGYQLFVPELAMDLRERVRQRQAQSKITALLPAAQAMLLARLHEGWNNDTPFPASTLMGDLSYSRVTLSKVVEQLLLTGLLHATGFKGANQTYRFSTAYGYAQAKDETWADYKREAGGWGASRDDFADALDFMGWYMQKSQRVNGVSKWDAFGQYLNYHEGWGGYRNRSYDAKPWLVNVSQKVQARASVFGAQYRSCEQELSRGGWF